MTTKKLLKDIKATSPAIATLVLIVIAVVAAAGVGVITMSIQTQTEGQAGAKDLSVAGTIDVQGSTTVLPFALEAAKTFMDDHPAVEITVAGGGSTHGINMAKENKIDIGLASKQADVEDILQQGYAGAVLYETEVGKRLVAVIMNDGASSQSWNVALNTTDLDNGTISIADIKTVYDTTDGVADVDGKEIKAFQRADSSGTEECFAAWLNLKDSEKQLDSDAQGEVGNPGVWNAVTTNPTGSTKIHIGFVDLGFVEDSKYAADMNGEEVTAANYDDYETASDDVGSSKLTSKLYFYTYGVPSGAVDAFIQFCLSDATGEGQDILEEVGLIAL